MLSPTVTAELHIQWAIRPLLLQLPQRFQLAQAVQKREEAYHLRPSEIGRRGFINALHFVHDGYVELTRLWILAPGKIGLLIQDRSQGTSAGAVVCVVKREGRFGLAGIFAISIRCWVRPDFVVARYGAAEMLDRIETAT